jgi:hypothetical protein
MAGSYTRILLFLSVYRLRLLRASLFCSRKSAPFLHYTSDFCLMPCVKCARALLLLVVLRLLWRNDLFDLIRQSMSIENLSAQAGSRPDNCLLLLVLLGIRLSLGDARKTSLYNIKLKSSYFLSPFAAAPRCI